VETVATNVGGQVDVLALPSQPPNEAPSISLASGSVSYTEDSPAIAIDNAATTSDPDGDADWDGGTLEVQITANAESADELSIPDLGPEGTVTGASTLTVTFDADATNSLVQEMVQAVHYRNTSDNPGTDDRTVTFTLTDKKGGSAVGTRPIQVGAVNDAPSLSPTRGSVTYTEDGPAIVIADTATVSDPDADWDGGTLEVQITDGAESTDVIGIPDFEVGADTGDK